MHLLNGKCRSMKKLLFILVIISSLGLTGSAQLKKIQELTGRWIIAGEDPGSYLEIVDSANIYLNYMGERKKIINYTADFTKTPGWFDFTVPDSSGVLHIKSLVQVFGDNTMKWQLFLDEDRTTYFTAQKGELLYLKKTAIPGSAVAKSQ